MCWHASHVFRASIWNQNPCVRPANGSPKPCSFKVVLNLAKGSPYLPLWWLWIGDLPSQEALPRRDWQSVGVDRLYLQRLTRLAATYQADADKGARMGKNQLGPFEAIGVLFGWFA